MPKLVYATVAEYLSSHPPATRRILKQVRQTIRKAVPDAEESISYNIPAYKLRGRPLLYFAGWREHFSLYPSSRAMEATFKAELARFAKSKGTIRFPLGDPPPMRLIARLAKFRAAELRATKTSSRRSS